MKLLQKSTATCVTAVYIWAVVIQLQLTVAQNFQDIARVSRREADNDVAALERSTAQVNAGNRRAFGRRRGLSSRQLMHLVHGNRRSTAGAARAGRTFAGTSRRFAARAALSIDAARASTAAATSFKAAMSDVCKSEPMCDRNAKYRTADGSCNNLKHPMWGMASIPQRRELKPEYSDDMGEPRKNGIDGLPLPSARSVSVAVHRSSRTTRDRSNTVLLMQYGQFTDHDLIVTPLEAGFDGEPLDCCVDTSEACFPIRIVQPDPHFSTTCMEFTRSLPAVDIECKPSHREQVNELTSFIDASQVYGSSQDHQNVLRAMIGGRLNTTGEHHLPQDSGNPEEGCVLDAGSGDYCPVAGDVRAIEQPGLATMHTTFLREHNRIARELERINPNWNDETIFQEARKIVIGIAQHITYNEFLPTVLGTSIVRRYRLKPKRTGFDNVYNDKIDATISNAFGAAAFRFGHSMIPDKLASSNSNYQEIASTKLERTFFNPRFLLQHSNGLSRWMASTQGFKVDRKIELSVSDLLFVDPDGKSFDLASLNIQRGRDHGLPPYLKWRRLCNLYPEITQWGTGSRGLKDHDRDAANILKSVYRTVKDIDLFPAGMSEKPLRGAVVGPTFACIIARQFQRLKTGDRFYYENYNPNTGFSRDQLREIKKVTLSKVLCENMNITRIQRYAFKKRNRRNKLKYCNSLPAVNLEEWRETPPGPILHTYRPQIWPPRPHIPFRPERPLPPRRPSPNPIPPVWEWRPGHSGRRGRRRN